MSFLAQVTYTGNGSTTGYAIPFSYIASSHVKAFINNVATTAFTVSGSTLTFTSAPANSAVIRIERQTPTDARLVDFTDGSVLTEADLDQSADQNFFIAQETSDANQSSMTIDTDDKFDAQSKVIKNVANPVNNNDAVNKTYLENTWLSTSDKATLTNVNNNITAINTVNSNISAITTNNSNATNINTVATNIGSVNTVATDITKVIAVANDLAEAVSEIETVADDLNEASSEIDVVAGSIANVNTVGGAIANVNTVAGANSNITTLAGISSNITSVANISSDVTSVAGISSAVSAVNSNSTNINAVNSNSSNINTVAGMSTAINTVNSNSTNINTVAGANTNITNVAGAITNINTVAGNLAGVNSFGERYRVQSGTPTTSLDVGDLAFDTASNTMKVYSSGGWINAGSSVNGTADRFEYTATAGQTTFSGADSNGNTLTYDAGFVDIFLNGVKLANADYTATSGNSIVLATGASLNDILMVVAYGTFQLANFSITSANDVPALGSAGQALVVNSGGTALEFSNASSAEVYGFNKNSNGQLIITTTNQGVDNISSSTFATFDDVLFSASGFTFSISNGELITTI